MLQICTEVKKLVEDIAAESERNGSEQSFSVYESRLQAICARHRTLVGEQDAANELREREIKTLRQDLAAEKAEIGALEAKYEAALAEFDIPPMDSGADFTSMRRSFTERITGQSKEIDELKGALEAEREANKQFRHQAKQKILDLEQLIKNREISERTLRCTEPASGIISEAAQFVIADLESQIIELKRKNTDLEIVVNQQRFQLAGME